MELENKFLKSLKFDRFDQLIQKIEQDLLDKKECKYELNNFTNTHGIPFDIFCVEKIYTQSYSCEIHHTKNFVNGYSLFHNDDLESAINGALIGTNEIDCCKNCSTVTKVNGQKCDCCMDRFCPYY
jgi:hypothetical protein